MNNSNCNYSKIIGSILFKFAVLLMIIFKMRKRNICYLIFFYLLIHTNLAAQDESDNTLIRSLHENAVTDSKAYGWLEYICLNIGHRLSGSPQLAAATHYTKSTMEGLGLDKVWLQPCMVPHWERGNKEECRVINSHLGNFDLNVLALGNTTGTGPNGVKAEVLVVMGLAELEKLNDKDVKGKIVFFNRPFQESALNTFIAYRNTVDQRGRGPQLAAKKGAVAALVRSVSANPDDAPHTGATNFEQGAQQIPCYALGNQSSDLLTELCAGGKVEVFCRSDSRMLDPVEGFNVIGEIRGSKYPDEIIIVGGHLDSWDVGHGAHDDGAGCVQAIEVLRLLKSVNYKPQRTIRAIMYTNEENGLAGGKAYKAYADQSTEKQLMAIESDAGGHSPKGFFYEADAGISPVYNSTLAFWKKVLEPYGYQFIPGGSGSDIGTLKPNKTFLLGLMPDSQRYFDYHHSSNDTFDKVNRRELELGAAAMASIVYLADKYELKN